MKIVVTWDGAETTQRGRLVASSSTVEFVVKVTGLPPDGDERVLAYLAASEKLTVRARPWFGTFRKAAASDGADGDPPLGLAEWRGVKEPPDAWRVSLRLPSVRESPRWFVSPATLAFAIGQESSDVQLVCRPAQIFALAASTFVGAMLVAFGWLWSHFPLLPKWVLPTTVVGSVFLLAVFREWRRAMAEALKDKTGFPFLGLLHVPWRSCGALIVLGALLFSLPRSLLRTVYNRTKTTVDYHVLDTDVALEADQQLIVLKTDDEVAENTALRGHFCVPHGDVGCGLDPPPADFVTHALKIEYVPVLCAGQWTAVLPYLPDGGDAKIGLKADCSREPLHAAVDLDDEALTHALLPEEADDRAPANATMSLLVPDTPLLAGDAGDGWVANLAGSLRVGVRTAPREEGFAKADLIVAGPLGHATLRFGGHASRAVLTPVHAPSSKVEIVVVAPGGDQERDARGRLTCDLPEGTESVDVWPTRSTIVAGIASLQLKLGPSVISTWTASLTAADPGPPWACVPGGPRGDATAFPSAEGSSGTLRLRTSAEPAALQSWALFIPGPVMPRTMDVFADPKREAHERFECESRAVPEARPVEVRVRPIEVRGGHENAELLLESRHEGMALASTWSRPADGRSWACMVAAQGHGRDSPTYAFFRRVSRGKDEEGKYDPIESVGTLPGPPRCNVTVAEPFVPLKGPRSCRNATPLEIQGNGPDWQRLGCDPSNVGMCP